jgi:hypothetical protein
MYDWQGVRTRRVRIAKISSVLLVLLALVTMSSAVVTKVTPNDRSPQTHVLLP